MTNKEKYINAFSGVAPSDETKERILNMASTKKRYSLKATAVVLAVFIMVAVVMLTANAATDGALSEKFDEVSKEITEKISIMFNGEEIDVNVKQSVVTDENGKTNVYEIILPDNVPQSKQGTDVLELDNIMKEFSKIVIQKEDGNVAEYEVYIENESDNYNKVAVESD